MSLRKALQMQAKNKTKTTTQQPAGGQKMCKGQKSKGLSGQEREAFEEVVLSLGRLISPPATMQVANLRLCLSASK